MFEMFWNYRYLNFQNRKTTFFCFSVILFSVLFCFSFLYRLFVFINLFWNGIMKERTILTCWCNFGYRLRPMTRDKNKLLRLQQAQQWKAAGEKFDNVFFTDESTVSLERFALKCWRKKDFVGVPKYKVKHPLKVHVWSGISRCGPGPLLIFEGKWWSV